MPLPRRVRYLLVARGVRVVVVDREEERRGSGMCTLFRILFTTEVLWRRWGGPRPGDGGPDKRAKSGF